MTPSERGALAASIVFGAARVALGALWLVEGVTKYRAGFGGADIAFVTAHAADASRVPDYFSWFAASVMAPLSGLFGVLMPLLETLLGVLLVLGILTLPAAIASIGTLLLYWSADQLIDQYPVMAALSVAVIACPLAASRWSATTALLALRRRPDSGLRRPVWRRWV